MTLGHNDSTINIVMAIIIIIIIVVVVVVVTVAPAQLYPSRIIILTLRPRSMRNSVCVTNGRVPVLPSVRLSRRSTAATFAADRPMGRNCRSVAAGATYCAPFLQCLGRLSLPPFVGR